MITYYFGLYHWRERLTRLAVILVAGLLSSILVRRSDRGFRLLGLFGVTWTAVRGYGVLASFLYPPPWVVETYKYEALAERLPLAQAEELLDVGCGTGRSLVGLASAIPENCRVLGLDVFDDEIIFGNGPALAARNAREAGLSVTPLRGDATRLPIERNSHDVVTACRLLHDLSADDATVALEEARRVCKPEGSVGILELPITHGDDESDPETYWQDLVAASGFDVEHVERVPRRSQSGAYVVVVGTPAER